MLSKLKDHFQHKSIGYGTAILSLCRNIFKSYKSYSLDEIRRNRKTDTIFILGSGPELGDLTKDEVATIQNQDSFGVNYSFLRKDIIPTYFQMEVGRKDWEIDTFKKHFEDFRVLYSKAIFTISGKAVRRFIHPLLLPNYFAEAPQIFQYELVDPIFLEGESNFQKKDFDRTFYYRGSLTLVLDLARKMGYSKFVLVGVQPNVADHFFDKIPTMAEFVRLANESHNQNNPQYLVQHETMVPKPGRPKTIEQYLISLNQYLKETNQGEIFTLRSQSMFAPALKTYNDLS